MEKVLKDAILNGLYDTKYPGQVNLTPQLLSNSNEKIWLSLRQELITANSFTWAVAFISEDMLVPLKQVLADTKISGTIITGSYLQFNSPKVFTELMKIPNLTVKISNKPGFHAKGFLFNHVDYQTAIIGSANFTRSAMLANSEWCLKVSSTQNASLTQQLQAELNDLTKTATPLTTEWIDDYAQTWAKPQAQAPIITQEIKPNLMQKEAIKNLFNIINQGQKRALVVSATGTGKTYLAAFAVKKYQLKRFLYLVHRAQIAKKAMSSFQKVIGGRKSDYGLLSGKHHDYDAKYLFATIQTLSQEDLLKSLDPAEFDFVLIDEAHRTAAPSYQRVLNHLEPKFLLGMTATPERMDKENVFEIFDYNLAYEIRLQDALQEGMLTPFHYVGVEDYEVNGQSIDETTNLAYLTASKRVDYLLKEIDYYGYCGQTVHGLVFCSRQAEAKELAQEFSKRGHQAISLTNENTESERQQAVNDLESGRIEYIITVDLFNEGIDIPCLNQVIMLRNTQSSIVFIQQLGRGLRKYPGKDYVTVIDFIGNYQNNYLIPLALTGDRSASIDRAKREAQLPSFDGLSTINFSRIASERILASLAKIKLDGLKQLREAYHELKDKLGKRPLLYDFYRFGSVSPLVFAQNTSLASYATFLKKMGEELTLTQFESQVLSFLTKELLPGKRIHELLLLNLLLKHEKVTSEQFETELKQHHAYCSRDLLASVQNFLMLDFFDVKAGKTTKKAQYGNTALIERLNLFDFTFSQEIKKALEDVDFKTLFTDLIKTGLALNQAFDNSQEFTLYQPYDRKDACHLLNWPLDVSAPMYGYRVGEKDCPIFIIYNKTEEKRSSIYQNDFSDGRSLHWYTRSPRHLDSDEVQRLLSGKVKLHLFVKKSDAASREFFYLGEAKIMHAQEEKIGPKQKATVGMDLLLQTPLTSDMYQMLFTSEK